MGESENMGVSTWLSQLYGRLPKTPISFLLHLEYGGMLHSLGGGDKERLARTTARALHSIEETQILLAALWTPLGSVSQIAGDDSRLWIPQLAYGYPPYRLSPAPHTSLLHTTTLWLPSYVHEPPQMSSEHVQKASQIISAFCDESLIIISDLLFCWN